MEEMNLLNQINDTNEKKEIEQYFIQINRIKLKDYLNIGLITPDIYLGLEHEKDIQSKNKHFLALSDGYINQLDESQILLEIILTDDEKQKLCQSGEIFYIDTPLPISRIKKIYVKDKTTLNHILVSIKNSENGILPKELFDVFLKKSKNTFSRNEYSALDDSIQPKDYSKQIRVFDKRMGMFSFMKNANLYYSDNTRLYSTYATNYATIFSTLLENPITDKTYNDFDILIKYQNFKELLFSDSQIDKNFILSFSETIEDDEIKALFLEFLKPVGTRELIKEFARKNLDIYYLIGLIYYFKQRDDNNKLENLKTNIADLIPFEKAEISLAVLGIYYGYSRLRSYETIDFQDKYFKKLGTSFNIKLEMNSKFDYITVETIYQKCFNGGNGYEFKYLEYPKYKSNIKLPTDKEFKTWYKIEKIKYFDVENVLIKKFTTLEMFGNLLGKFSDEIVENRQSRYLIPFVQYNFCELLKINTNGQKYFKKDELIRELELSNNEKIKNELIYIVSIG